MILKNYKRNGTLKSYNNGYDNLFSNKSNFGVN